MRKIAVYGTLKSGFYNHKRIGLGEPIAKSKICGAMYRYISYPLLFKKGVRDSSLEREHDVEIYEIDESTFSSINAMEVSSGYYATIESFGEHEAVVYYSNSDIVYEENWIEEFSSVTCPQAVV